MDVFQICLATGLAILALDFLLGGLSNFISLDFGLDLDGETGGHGWLGFMSPSSLTGFLVAFGGIGWFLKLLSWAGPLVWLIAILAGTLSSWAVVKLVRLLYKWENTSAPKQDSLVGLPAVVVDEIPAQGFGSIRYSVNGNSFKGPAKSFDQVRIPQGKKVAIVHLENHVFYVTSMETEEWTK